jgi:hypothetical protein
MKKCPPGVICVENFSMFFVIICIFIIGYLIYTNTDKSVTVNNNPSEKIVIKDTERENYGGAGWFSGWIPSWPYNNLSMFQDPLLNPYAPPLRDERYFIPGFNMMTRPHSIPINPGGIPINVSTNIGAVDTNYRQLGILAPSNGSSKDSVIPLMGRPLFTNRDKWQYYTSSNQHNNVKLPVTKAGKSCTNEYGCDRLDNGDTVYIEGANEVYRVTMYDNDTIKYLPFI